jgi:hypothetical protein
LYVNNDLPHAFQFAGQPLVSRGGKTAANFRCRIFAARLKLSREGFVLKNETGNGNGERAKIRAAILKRHVSR